MNLFHLITRHWRQRMTRSALTMLSVAIAVAAVLGTLLAQTSVRQSYRQLAEAVEGRPALEIVAKEGGRFRAADAGEVSAVAGVEATLPMVARGTLARIEGKRLRGLLLGLPLTPEAWGELKIVEGRACTEAGETVLDAAVAKRVKAQIGDRVVMLTRRGPRSAKLVGLVDSRSLRKLAAGAALAMPLEQVQEFFGVPDEVDRVRVYVKSRDLRPAVEAVLASQLPKHLLVQMPAGQMVLAESLLQSSELALHFAGALSVAMAMFIILNSLRMNFGERRATIAMVRVLGATSGQVFSLHLLEGAILGLLGSLLGIPLGILLGRGLALGMQPLLRAEIPPPETSYTTVLAVLVCGPIVAALASLVPALQARNITPKDAMQDGDLRGADRFPWWAVVTGLVCWCTAVVLMLLVIFHHLPAAMAIPGGLLMLVAFISLIPAVVKPTVRISAWLLAPLMGVQSDLAAETILRRRTRTGLTVGVLVIAMSNGFGLGNAVINNVDDVHRWYRRSLEGDVFLVDPLASGAVIAGQDETPTADVIAATPGVRRVAEIRYRQSLLNAAPVMCVVRPFPADRELPWELSAAEADEVRAKLAAGQMVVGAGLAKRQEVEVGDEMRLEFGGRVLALPVAAIVNDHNMGGQVVFLDQAAAAERLELGAPNLYMIEAQPGVDAAQLATAFEPLANERGLEIQSFADLRRQLDQLMNGVVGALWGLLGIGFFVGGVAIANTLTMSILEQTRQLGLLRVVGMTRRQIRLTVFCESLLLALTALFMGTQAGVATAWIIHLCHEPLLGYAVPFHFNWGLFTANALGCVIVTLIAAYPPGNRAAGLKLLEAIAYE